VGHDHDAFAVQQVAGQDDVFGHFRIQLSTSVSDDFHITLLETKHGVGNDPRIHAGQQKEPLSCFAGNAFGVKRSGVRGVRRLQGFDEGLCIVHATQPRKVAFGCYSSFGD